MSVDEKSPEEVHAAWKRHYAKGLRENAEDIKHLAAVNCNSEAACALLDHASGMVKQAAELLDREAEQYERGEAPIPRSHGDVGHRDDGPPPG
jgi:hypothetical protein